MTVHLPEVSSLAPRVAAACLGEATGFEFQTFLIGVHVEEAAPARRVGRERRCAPEVEAWKVALKRAAGEELERVWAGLGRVCQRVRAELLFVWDVEREQLAVTARALHVYGRYRKLARDLPQTPAPWRCTACGGRPEAAAAACATCRGTGRRYATSVAELVGAPCARAFRADGSLLHGMGREDIDVRCLGAGRPFVLELRQPRRRAADLDAVRREVEAGAAGRVELPSGLRLVPDEVVARVKGHDPAKVYRVTCQAERALDPAALAALPGRLSGRVVEQRTPERVSRRRGDHVRPRRVLGLRVEATPAADTVVLDVETEAGTYVKELVSGDGGRTRPSLGELLGVPCRCVALDVLDVRCGDDEVLGAQPMNRVHLT